MIKEDSIDRGLPVGQFASDKSMACDPGKSTTRHIRFSSANHFAWGDAALESAIEVASLEVRIARNETEHESAMRWLEQLQAQREVRA